MDLTVNLVADTVRYIVAFLNFDDAMSLRITNKKFRKIINKKLVISLYRNKQKTCNTYIREMMHSHKEDTITCLFLYDVRILLLKLDERKYPSEERDMYYMKIGSTVKTILESKKYNFENENISWNDISHDIMMQTRDQTRSMKLKTASKEFLKGFRAFCSKDSDSIK